MLEHEGLTWYEEGGGYKGEYAACTVAKILFAKEGEVEGGLGALARFMLGSLHPEVSQPELSPAGWYWAVAVQGRWSSWTLAPDVAAARELAERAYFDGRASL